MINFVVVRGNLTKDPELRYSPNGSAFCKFAIAANRKYKSGEEFKEEVSYLDVTSLGRQGEACAECLKKGSDVLVEGRLKQDRWEAEDGTKRSKVGIMASSVNFLNRKGESGNAEGKPANPTSPTGPTSSDEDIPF